MKTLIVYDNTGKIYSQQSGTYTKPDGLQYIECEVPDGYIVTGVDVAAKQPILAKIPPSESDKMAAQLLYTAMMTGTLI